MQMLGMWQAIQALYVRRQYNATISAVIHSIDDCNEMYNKAKNPIQKAIHLHLGHIELNHKLINLV